MSDRLDLELQTVVSHVIVVRGTEEQQVLLTAESPLQSVTSSVF